MTKVDAISEGSSSDEVEREEGESVEAFLPPMEEIEIVEEEEEKPNRSEGGREEDCEGQDGDDEDFLMKIVAERAAASGAPSSLAVHDMTSSEQGGKPKGTEGKAKKKKPDDKVAEDKEAGDDEDFLLKIAAKRASVSGASLSAVGSRGHEHESEEEEMLKPTPLNAATTTMTTTTTRSSSRATVLNFFDPTTTRTEKHRPATSAVVITSSSPTAANDDGDHGTEIKLQPKATSSQEEVEGKPEERSSSPPSLSQPQPSLPPEPVVALRPGAVYIRGPSSRGGFGSDDDGEAEGDNDSEEGSVEIGSVSEGGGDGDGATAGSGFHDSILETQSLPGFLVDDEDDDNDQLENASQQQPEAGAGAVVDGRAVRTKNKYVENAGIAGIMLLLVIIVIMGMGLGGVFDSSSAEEGDHSPAVVVVANNSDIQKGQGSVTTSSPEQGAAATTAPEQQEQAAAQTEVSPILTKIKERGYLKCAYTDVSRLEKAFCEVMAAAILGNHSLMEFVPLQIGGDRFVGLQDGRADMVINVVSHSMERNVLEPTTLQSYSFSKPYLFTGAAIAGRPFFVNCTEDNLNHLGDCQKLKVCVPPQGTVYKSLSKTLPQRNLVFWTNGIPELISALNNGTCNTVGMGRLLMDLPTARFFGLQGDFVYGKPYYTKDPLSIVTPSNDTFYSNLVNAVFDSLLAAEQSNITKEIASTTTQQLRTDLFGEEYHDVFARALSVHGNYGEIYRGFFTDYFPREANELNNGSSGLIYSYPFGFVSTNNFREGKPLDDSIQSILNHGAVRCGVRPNRNGFAIQKLEEEETSAVNGWEGMDIDYCRALAAALFRGDADAVEFVGVETQEDGFRLLVDGQVDVVAGATRTFSNGIREATTGRAFDFSLPYFYSEEEDNLCLATLQTTDKDWFFLVWWVVSASFYAEEQGITRLNSSSMPEVFLYGEDYKRIFRDTVLAVGSHQEIYERNVEPLIPRSGRNLLNYVDNLKVGPQQYVLPGFLDALVKE